MDHLRVPCSRYGSTTDEVAWYAVCAEYAYNHVLGYDSDPAVGLEFMMGLAVNDSPEIATVIHDTYPDLPHALRDKIAPDSEIREMMR